jgi:hypothetical protein
MDVLLNALFFDVRRRSLRLPDIQIYCIPHALLKAAAQAIDFRVGGN